MRGPRSVARILNCLLVPIADEIPGLGTDSPQHRNSNLNDTPSPHYHHCIVAPACIFLRERFAYCALTRHISITINRFLDPSLPCPLQGFRDNSSDGCHQQSATPLLRTYMPQFPDYILKGAGLLQHELYASPLVATQSYRPRPRGSPKHRRQTPVTPQGRKARRSTSHASYTATRKPDLGLNCVFVGKGFLLYIDPFSTPFVRSPSPFHLDLQLSVTELPFNIERHCTSYALAIYALDYDSVGLSSFRPPHPLDIIAARVFSRQVAFTFVFFSFLPF